MFEINYHGAVILHCVLTGQHPEPGKSQKAVWKLRGVASRRGGWKVQKGLIDNARMQ